jgi:hypothetical protein
MEQLTVAGSRGVSLYRSFNMIRASWLPVIGILMSVSQIPGTPVAAKSAADGLVESASHSSIPAAYRGRWASSASACRVKGLQTTAVVITDTGWTSFEDGSRITAPGKVLRGTLYHEVASFGSGGESKRGTLAVRLAGNRLAMSETVSGRTVHRHLMRCR